MTQLEQFLDLIAFEPMSGCWLWIGRRNKHDYGVLSDSGRDKLAHRMVYEAVKGPIPEGLEPDHLCRVHPCVCPDHLEPVTRRINQWRGFGFAGVNHRKTHCPQGHEYTPENTIIKKKGFGRECRSCKRHTDAKRLDRLRAEAGLIKRVPKVTPQVMEAVRLRYASGQTQDELAAFCGISQTAVWAILREKLWLTHQ
jgi:predicted DNA-binding protein (UPF0251 family)